MVEICKSGQVVDLGSQILGLSGSNGSSERRGTGRDGKRYVEYGPRP